MRKIKNKLQKCIKHIKTMFYTFLCVSLRKDTNNQTDKEKKCRFDKKIEHMLMTFEQFENANMVFQRLLNDIEDLTEIKKILVEEMNNLPETNRYDFLRHISTLFLNIYLSGYRYGEKGKEKSTNVRRIIYDIIIENNY